MIGCMQGEVRTRSVGSCKIDYGTLGAMLDGICWISSFVGSHSCVGFLRWIPQPALRRLPSEENDSLNMLESNQSRTCAKIMSD